MEKWELAFDDYAVGMKYKDIAKKYEVTLDTVKNWKKRKWPKVTQKSDPKSKRKSVRKSVIIDRPENRSAPPAPQKNQLARTHGLYAKWLPEEINEILGEAPTDPIDILWSNIQLQQAKIIHSFKIHHVKDKDDCTKRVISETEKGEVYQYTEAQEKDAAFLQGLSRALATLNNMITNYERLIHENWDLATELQKARVDQAKAEVQRIKADLEDAEGTAVQIVDDIKEATDDGGSQAD